MATLKAFALLFSMLPTITRSLTCERDYDSPKLWLNIEPEYTLKENVGNITVTCRVTPYQNSLTLRSWLNVTRSQTVIRNVEKTPLKDGPYNLTLHLSKDDFGNETQLDVTCQSVMLSSACTNTTKTIRLLDRLPKKHGKNKGNGRTLSTYQLTGIAAGLTTLVVGLLIVGRIYFVRRKSKKPPDAILDPLTECDYSG